MMQTFEKNKKLFSLFKELRLPLGQYAITSSGVLGVRDLREMGDIDVIVDAELWDVLAGKCGIIQEEGIQKIALVEGFIEAFGEHSFSHKNLEDRAMPTVTERIAAAEIINGLAFESLEHVIYFKQLMAREKDLKDILLIEAWKKDHDK
jgi:hypothetical protein